MRELERLRPVYETGVLRLLLRQNAMLYVSLLRSTFDPLTGELPRETVEERFAQSLNALADAGEYAPREDQTFAEAAHQILADLTREGEGDYAWLANSHDAASHRFLYRLTARAHRAIEALSRLEDESRALSGAQANSIIMALAGAERIFKMMDEESETDEGYVTLVNAKYDRNDQLVETDERTGIWAWKHPHHDGTTTYHKLEGSITFTDVDFGYVPEKTVLHDINLYGRPGQKIAFVGSTGAGKTTITNLINRFYDIQEGQILYDGISVAGIKKPDLRRSLGIVLQDVNLFTGTVMDNIRYGRLNATDEECIEAARLVNADSFIRMLPGGYNTVLEGDGSGLSQGQRQLISIARAAVADPPALILDEATSSIDTRTEEVVQAGMDNLMKGRTVFVIAHRLSTVRNSDVIMVLDHGNIIERGSHDELIAQKGEYYQLYTGAVELE